MWLDSQRTVFDVLLTRFSQMNSCKPVAPTYFTDLIFDIISSSLPTQE